MFSIASGCCLNEVDHTYRWAGGCGKTRLALWLANTVKDKSKDEVFCVELASVADSALVPQMLVKALNISAQPEANLIDTLVDHLRG